MVCVSLSVAFMKAKEGQNKTLDSNQCWVVLAQFWVKYGQTIWLRF